MFDSLKHAPVDRSIYFGIGAMQPCMIAPNLQTLSGIVLPGVFACADLARAPFLSVQSVCCCGAAALDLAPQRVIIAFENVS